MTDAPAIEVQDLHKTYRDGLILPRRFEALKGISLQVARGEIFGLLGPNGAGKTTLVKLLLGVVKKTRGTPSCWAGRRATDTQSPPDRLFARESADPAASHGLHRAGPRMGN